MSIESDRWVEQTEWATRNAQEAAGEGLAALERAWLEVAVAYRVARKLQEELDVSRLPPFPWRARELARELARERERLRDMEDPDDQLEQRLRDKQEG